MKVCSDRTLRLLVPRKLIIWIENLKIINVTDVREKCLLIYWYILLPYKNSYLVTVYFNTFSTSMLSFKENLSGFFPWELPVVIISPEWVTGPEQGSPVVRLLTLASRLACLGMALPSLPRVMKHYSPTGRKNHGRPLKRLLDTWDRDGLKSGPSPWKIYYYDDDDI